jgi:DNA-binding transcriptional regulator YdaS (Cro superfamily)
MDEKPTPFEALNDAVTRAGSQSAIARICGVSQTAVWKWLQSGKRLPAEYVLPVEAETGVSKHLLRPDIYPVDEQSSGSDDHIADEVTCEASAVACEQEAVSHRRRAA